MIVEPTGSNTAATGAIRQAAQMTGADFKYLLATAQVESNLNPHAKAATSSARGLFQFTEQTWLATLKEQGPAFGYGPYAAAVARQPGGDYAVADPRMTRAVMNLRSDPTANALMAGAFTKANSEKLTAGLGRNPTEGELYIAHFLGSNGASRMIALAKYNPQAPAAAAFSMAARANPTIFYTGGGNARSAGEVYRLLVSRYEAARKGPASALTATVDADKPSTRPSTALDTAKLTAAYAAGSDKLPKPRVLADAGPVFHGLFRSSGGPEPVAPLVNSLWTTPARSDNAAVAAPPGPAAGGNDRGLFQDQTPDARVLFRGRTDRI